MKQALKIEDLRDRARSILPKWVFDYLEGGVEDETCLTRNIQSLGEVQFNPRRLVDVSKRSQQIELLGSKFSSPFIVGPTGLNDLFWPKGDLALAHAAALEGVPFVLSTASSSTMEDVADATNGDWWFQLYVLDRDNALRLVNRAQVAGCKTLMITVDVTLNGNRERDLRNGFGTRLGLKSIIDTLCHPRWLARTMRFGAPLLAHFQEQSNDSCIRTRAAVLRRSMDATFDWESFSRLRDLWPGILIVKGLLRLDDVVKAYERGADAVVLSNHGGRQLDFAPSAFNVLQEVAPFVDKPILLDGGIRRGSDVVKARALGASAVLLGRAPLYGLAAAGQWGAVEALRLIKKEIDNTLGQIGYPHIRDLRPDCLKLMRSSSGSYADTVIPAVSESPRPPSTHLMGQNS